MQDYFVDHNLASTLGEQVMPNVFATFQVTTESSSSTGEQPMLVLPCTKSQCPRSQADLLHLPYYPYDTTRSQLWNEKCFIHALRMVAMAIDTMYQNEVQRVCTDSSGQFLDTPIKARVWENAQQTSF